MKPFDQTASSKNNAPNLLATLKHIALVHRKKLAATFALVAAENLFFLLYPIVGSFAVNAVLNGNVRHALVYALMVFLIWLVGSMRRRVDTQTFTRIYAELAVSAVLNTQAKSNTSSAAAHAALSRQFVNFFEKHLPVLVTAVFSIVGSVMMLMVIEFWSGIAALCVLIGFASVLPSYTKMNDRLYFKLNNRLENEVSVIGQNRRHGLIRHYHLLSKIRIAISNREASAYLVIGTAMAFLFGITLILLGSRENVQAGHIYAVITYLWTFALSLDDMPAMMEELSELKDIGQRVEIA